MTPRPLAIITTRLPPQTCGVGAYSWQLRQHWPGSRSSVEFLVLDDTGAAERNDQRDRVTSFHGCRRELARSLERIGEADVTLHYAGRAFDRFGTPGWLPRVLAAWKRQFPTARLMVIFHELPGDAPLLSRYFLLNRLSAAVAKRLVGLADVVVTNTATHATKLRRWTRGAVHVLPVGSNIPVQATGAARARGDFLVFGLAFGRLQTLRVFDAHVRGWIRAGRLARLHLVGPTDDKFATEADELMKTWSTELRIVRHGALPSAEVSRILSQAEFALTNVTSETWSKSGAFMACAAHSCPTVVRERDAAEPLRFAISADEVESISENKLAARTASLRAWYEQNADWPVIANRLATLWRE